MTKPHDILFWMFAFLAAAIVMISFIFDPLRHAFLSNPWFNALIIGLFILGVAFNFRQVLRLFQDINWMEDFRKRDREGIDRPTPLLAPMAQMLGNQTRGQLSLSTTSMRSLLDTIGNRLDESRDVARYLIGLLIFLGLLGTFWGLIVSIGSVSEIIKDMNVEGADSATIFESLKQSLQQPLSGMGIAFSSSMFGLAGSLILGFLDLQASHAQRRFFNELEEWLSGITRLSTGVSIAESETSVPAYVQALLEQTADRLEHLQRVVSEQARDRAKLDEYLSALSLNLNQLTERLKTEGKAQIMEELREEFRLLNRTIAATLDKRSH